MRLIQKHKTYMSSGQRKIFFTAPHSGRGCPGDRYPDSSAGWQNLPV